MGVRRRLRHFTHTIFHALHARRARAPIRDSGAVAFQSSILLLQRAPSAAHKGIIECTTHTRRLSDSRRSCRRWRDHELVASHWVGAAWREVPSSAGGREARRSGRRVSARSGVLSFSWNEFVPRANRGVLCTHQSCHRAEPHLLPASKRHHPPKPPLFRLRNAPKSSGAITWRTRTRLKKIS